VSRARPRTPLIRKHCPGVLSHTHAHTCTHYTQEYWTDQFEILESGFDGEAPAEGELPADGGEPGAEPGGEQDEEAAPPPRPRKPRAPGSFCKTRWSDLGPKEIVRDMVEERIVHHVKFAGDLAVGNTRYTMDYKKSVNLRGTYNAAGKPPPSVVPPYCTMPSYVHGPRHHRCSFSEALLASHPPPHVSPPLSAAEWGPVCDRYDPPLPTISSHLTAAYPKGRHKAIFALIERLPQVCCLPPYPTPPRARSPDPGLVSGRASEAATTRSPPPGCAGR
jgi:hypothetical protein